MIFALAVWDATANPALLSASASSDSSSHGSPAPAVRRLSLGVVFLTLYIDLVGFSIIFPLFPKMLEYYLGREGDAGLLGSLMAGLRGIASWVGMENAYLPVLFGGVLGSLYSFLQFAFAPLWGGLSDRHGRRRILILTCAGTAFDSSRLLPEDQWQPGKLKVEPTLFLKDNDLVEGHIEGLGILRNRMVAENRLHNIGNPVR